MVVVRFPSETLAQYKFYSLCCHALLGFYEDLSKACDIHELVEAFDTGLSESYYPHHLAVVNIGLFLEILGNQYACNGLVGEILTSIRDKVHLGEEEWDFRSAVGELRDIGKGLAQDFYREGGKNSNADLMRSNTPELVLSNLCLSESDPCGFKEPRPISYLSGRIHLPFDTSFGFRHYLSYPFLFFHEYASHVYVPEIDSRTFEDGWMMYAIELFMKSRWADLCKKYTLVSAQRNVLRRVWLPRLGKLARQGYYLAGDVDAWIGDSDRFLRLTWDLASYPSILVGHLSFHHEFMEVVKQYDSRERGHLLGSIARNSSSALEFYAELKERRQR